MTTSRRIGRAAASAIAVLSATLAVGCGALQGDDGGQASGGGDSSAAPAPSSAAAPSEPSEQPAPPTEDDGSGSGGSGGGGGRAAKECKASELKVTVGKADGAAGTVYRPLQFTNSGSRKCVIRGYPGVSYVTGDSGRQVGEAAFRVGHKGAGVPLSPGATASAPIGLTQTGNYDPSECKQTPVRGLRVYPPHETASVFVPMSGTGCRGSVPGHQLTVGTIVPGVTGN